MARLILLNEGPLGLACGRPGTPLVDHCHAWLLALEVAGAEVMLLAIADYEVRRELLWLNALAEVPRPAGIETSCPALRSTRESCRQAESSSR